MHCLRQRLWGKDWHGGRCEYYHLAGVGGLIGGLGERMG